jgi:hypothetical protein
MIKEFVLLALVQVPTYVQESPTTYELQPVEYHETMQQCQLSRKVKLVSKGVLSFECLRRDFK